MFAHIHTRSGELHVGHLDWWADGRASIAGHLIEGVAFIDAMPPPLHHGGASRPARAAAGATDGVVSPGSRPAAVVDPSEAPAGVSPLTHQPSRDRDTEQESHPTTAPSEGQDGQGNPAGVSARKWCLTHEKPVRHRFVAAVCPNDIGCAVIDLPPSKTNAGSDATQPAL